MSNIGYVCALATSALDGAVCVAGTRRPPAEWASELSKSMRLASPFIVVYEQLFEDCEQSARFVSRYLEHKGYETYRDGEFIYAPVTEAVKAILIAPGALDDEDFDSSGTNGSEAASGAHGERDSQQIRLRDSAYQDAERYYLGEDGLRHDNAKAFRLFRQAASLGCPAAYRYLSTMTRRGEGVKADGDKSLEFLKEGSLQGSVACNFELAVYYTVRGQLDDAEKFASIFVDQFSYDSIDGALLTRSDVTSIDLGCAVLVHHKLHNRLHLPDTLRTFILDNARSVQVAAGYMAKSCKQSGDRSDESMWRKTIRLIETLPMNRYMTT